MTKISRMARATTLGLAGICGSLMSFSGVLNAAEFFDGRLNGRIYLMEGYQAIQADDGAFADANTNMSTGFQRLRYNLEVSAKINDYVTAYFDLAEEPNDFGTDDQFEISQDLGYIDVDLAGIIQNTPDHEDTWIFRAGNIVSTVFQYRGFSDGAAVQGNPLIGNSVIDLVFKHFGLPPFLILLLSGLTPILPSLFPHFSRILTMNGVTTFIAALHLTPTTDWI